MLKIFLISAILTTGKQKKLLNFIFLPLKFLRSWFRLQSGLNMENMALSRQLAKFAYEKPRPKLFASDKPIVVCMFKYFCIFQERKQIKKRAA